MTSLDIFKALGYGKDMLISRNGAFFLAAYSIIGTLNTYLMSTGSLLFTSPQNPVDRLSIVPPIIALPLGIVTTLILLSITLAFIRNCVEGNRNDLPKNFFTHRFLHAGSNLVLGLIIYFLIINLGFLLYPLFAPAILLVIPGLYLGVGTAFWYLITPTSTTTFIGGMQESWDMTSGHRARLAGLFGIILIIYLLLYLPLRFIIIAPEYVTNLATNIILGLYMTAVLAGAYRQLHTSSDSQDKNSTGDE
ncbi:MAG: hypothetical protein SVU32_08330 [Candidatus Nanohaloarchaea archaeon]|nr:hypothetical protein [Candidatus Nanohaloarchaea archaeon]